MIKSFTFLGTGSQAPRKDRACSSVYMALENGDAMLFDCGEGTQIQLEKASNVNINKISSIFITHLHGDHFFGLPGVLLTINSSQKQNYQRKKLVLVGPEGLRNALFHILCPHYANDDYFYYRLAQIYNQCGLENDCSDIANSHVVSGKTNLSDIKKEDSYKDYEDYEDSKDSKDIEDFKDSKDIEDFNDLKNERIFVESRIISRSNNETDKKSSRFKHFLNKHIETCLREKLVKLNIEYIEMETDSRRCYQFPDGSKLLAFPLNHTIPAFGYVYQESERRGKLDKDKVTNLGFEKHDYKLISKIELGETDTTEITEDLNETKDIDILVHESTYSKDEAEIAKERGHSTAEMAGRFANRMNAKVLFLTHFSIRHKTTKAMADTAQSAAPNTTVLSANDLDTYFRIKNDFVLLKQKYNFYKQNTF